MTDLGVAPPATGPPAYGEVVQGWTIDRRVPLALIVAGLVQFGLGCSAVAVLYSTVSAQGGRISSIEASRSERHEAELVTATNMRVDIARISERVDMILAALRPGLPKPP